jgi:hypothetical protein
MRHAMMLLDDGLHFVAQLRIKRAISAAAARAFIIDDFH